VGKLADSGYVQGRWSRRREVWVDVPQPGGGIARIIETSPVDELVWLDDDPCDGAAGCGDPVCVVENAQDAGSGYPDGSQRVERLVVHAFHGCIVEEELEFEVEGEPLDEDDWPKPKALDEEKMPEGVRVRGFVVASTDGKERLRKVAVAGGDGTLDLPGRLSFAGADFSSPDMDLWHMDWRSRLIRFRAPSDGSSATGGCGGEFAGECESVSGSAGGVIEDVGGAMADLVLH
jgi:hypothetical protein